MNNRTSEKNSHLDIYHIFAPYINGEDIRAYRKAARNAQQITDLEKRTSEGDESARTRLQNILFFGTASDMYHDLWCNVDVPEEEATRRDDVVNEMLRAPVDNNNPDRIRIDSLVLFVCGTLAASASSRPHFRKNGLNECGDVANEQYAAYLQHRDIIASADQPKYYLLHSLYIQRILLSREEIGAMPFLNKMGSEKRSIVTRVLEFSDRIDSDRKSQEFHREFSPYGYNVYYTCCRIYDTLRSRNVSIDEAEYLNEKEDAASPTCLGSPTIQYSDSEDRQYYHDILSCLPGALMQEAFYETYLSPDACDAYLHRTKERDRAYAVLHNRYNITREIYDIDIHCAERFMRELYPRLAS